MKKVNFFTGLFFNSERVFANIQPKIQNLEEEIKKIDAMENKIEAIVRLFQVISPIQDTGGFSQEIFDLKKHNRNFKFNAKVKALEALQKHFYNSGRSEYGINRTTKGEDVTNEKVFLGDVNGLWTQTAAYWLNQKLKLEQSFRPDVSKNPEKPISDGALIDVNSYCVYFVKSHVDGILEQIKMLGVA